MSPLWIGLFIGVPAIGGIVSCYIALAICEYRDNH